MGATVGQPQNVQVPVNPGACGVNIQIFNPTSYAPGAGTPANYNTNNYTSYPSYPQNYYTQNYSQPAQANAQATAQVQVPPPVAPQAQQNTESGKKTEKRQIVQLTDEYVKNVETYLNNQNKQVRLMGAKEVLARLQEDKTRKNDPALNALINKMLQDPYQPVKFIALAALESGDAAGDNTSVSLLKGIQQQKSVYGEDSLKASNVLLKMSSQKTEKEFEVTEKPKKEKEKEKE